MPTGYTRILFDKPGTTFAEFAQRCARAFGHAIAMRDRPLDEPLEDAVVSPFFREEIESIGKKLGVLCSMSPEEVEQRFQDAKSAAAESNAQLAASCEAACRTLDAMTKSVADWSPPSSHEELRRFMLSQLQDSRPLPYAAPIPSGSSADWWAADISATCEGLKRAVDRWQKAREVAADSNRWIASLRRSLEPKPAAPVAVSIRSEET